MLVSNIIILLWLKIQAVVVVVVFVAVVVASELVAVFVDCALLLFYILFLF